MGRDPKLLSKRGSSFLICSVLWCNYIIIGISGSAPSSFSILLLLHPPPLAVILENLMTLYGSKSFPLVLLGDGERSFHSCFPHFLWSHYKHQGLLCLSDLLPFQHNIDEAALLLWIVKQSSLTKLSRRGIWNAETWAWLGMIWACDLSLVPFWGQQAFVDLQSSDFVVIFITDLGWWRRSHSLDLQEIPQHV